MVAVVSGNGLGLFNTSLAGLGKPFNGQSGIGQSREGQWVNVATGNLVVQGADEGEVASRGLLEVFSRTYNSQGLVSNVGADSWLGNFEQKFTWSGTRNAAGSTVTRYGGDGEITVYNWSSSLSKYVSNAGDGADDTVVWNGTTSNPTSFVWTDGTTRLQETYGTSITGARLLSNIIDLKSGASYNVIYDASNRVSEIRTGGAGTDGLVLTYNGSGQLTTLSTREGGSTVSQVTYAYDGSGRLSTVTTDLTPSNTGDSSTFTSSYQYDSTSTRLTRVTQSDGVVVSYTYTQVGGVYKIATITVGDTNTNDADGAGNTLTFTYRTSPNLETDITDSANRTWTYRYNASGQVTNVYSPAVGGQRLTTTYAYDGNGNVTDVTDPTGDVTHYDYDSSNNLTLQRDGAGNTVKRTYSATNQVLTETTYQTPDPDGSGAGTASNWLTTRYAYDSSDRLRYAVDPQGEVTEYQYGTSGNGTGLLVMTRKFGDTRYTVSGLTETQTLSESTLNTWVTSRDKTNVIQSNFIYDARGQLQERDDFATVNSSGVGTADTAEQITKYSYSAQGLLLQSITVRGASRTVNETTTYTYDGMGRLLTTTDSTGAVTTRVYNDASLSLTVTQANNRTTTEVHDASGKTVSITDSGSVGGSQQNHATSFYYDTAGRLRAVQDPSGARSYRFYDDASRLSAEVDATGAVTEYVRDYDGNVTSVIRYATLVTTTSWLSGSTVTPVLVSEIRPSTNANDRTTVRTYDAAGRLATEVDAAGSSGATTTYSYDGLSRLTKVTVAATSDSSNARVTRYFYDASNRVLAVLDAEHYLTEKVFDPAGRLQKTIAYANVTSNTPNSNNNWLVGTLTDLRPSTHADDITTRYFYDARGNCIAVLEGAGSSGEGYLIEKVYDETLHNRLEKRWATKLTGLTGSETLATLRTAVNSGAKLETRTDYDSEGRISVQLNAEGTTTRYTYSNMGQLTKITYADATSEVRDNYRRYDVFGNLIGEIGGEGSTHITGTPTEAQLDAIYLQYGTTHTYDALNRRMTSIGPAGTNATGDKCWYYYDADSRVSYTVKGQRNSSGTANAEAEVEEYLYDAFGGLTSTTKFTTRIDATNVGTLTLLQTALNAVRNTSIDSTTTLAYDKRGLATSISDALGYATTRSYTGFGQLYDETRPISASSSVVLRHAYDKRGLELSRTEDPSGINRAVAQAYDAFGRVTSTTDGLGRVTSYTYDKRGRQVTRSLTVQGIARPVTTTYDAFDRVLTVKDAYNYTTTYAYNDTNRTVQVTTQEGVTMTTTHTRHGQTVSVLQNGVTTNYTYDRDGKLLTVSDPETAGTATTNTYDARGLATRTQDENGNKVDFQYDALGRVLKRIVDPTGLALTTTYAYDAQGRAITATDPSGNVTGTVYDQDGNVLTVTADQGSGKLNLTTTYTYDRQGRALTVIEGANDSATSIRTTYEYDLLGRLNKQRAEPTSGSYQDTLYAYDKEGNVTQKTDATGQLWRYAYDESNALVFTVDPTGAISRTYYDKVGSVTEVVRYATKLTSGQLSGLGSAPSLATIAGLVTVDATNDGISYQIHDRDGRLVYTMASSGAVVYQTYDAANRPSESLAYATPINIGALTTQQKTDLQSGAMTPTAFAALITASSSADRKGYTVYDAVGRVRFTVTSLGGGLGRVSEQEYDAGGRVLRTIDYKVTIAYTLGQTAAQTETAIASAGGNTAGNFTDVRYVYDAANRARFTVDALGGIVETNYFANGSIQNSKAYTTTVSLGTAPTLAQAQTAVASLAYRQTSYGYDGVGRLTSTTDATSHTESYTYFANGLKASFTNKSNKTWSYAYDKAGRLLEETSPQVAVLSFDGSGNLTSTTQTLKTTFAYDALGQIAARTEASNTSNSRTTAYTYDSAARQSKTTFVDPGVYNAQSKAFDAGTAPTSEVWYDAFGQAVVGKDALGNWSYKAYDNAGRLAYEIDAEGYVTGYGYDTFGEQTTLTRYATKLSFTGWTAGAAMKKSDVDGRLTTSSSNDRTITTTYDQLGRKATVTQSAVTSVRSDTLATYSASPKTSFEYDALGRVVKEGTLLELQGATEVWAYSFNYYDADGHKTLTVDAGGFVTAFTYTATGEVASVTEYARAISTVGLTTTTPPSLPSAGDEATGYDRTVSFSYDALGRKTTETSSRRYQDTSGNTSTANLVTTTEYDDLGNATASVVNGVRTETTYDDLGHVTSVTEAGRAVLKNDWKSQLDAANTTTLATTGLSQTASPYTEIGYDAFGNEVKVTRYANGKVGGTVTADSTNDQVMITRYDRHGRAVMQKDVLGNETYRVYDAAGNVTHLWMDYANYQSTSAVVSSTTSTLHRYYTYDKTGRQLLVETKRGSTSEAAEQAAYNAFGEITGKGTSTTIGSGLTEVHGYDKAGRQISSNSESGATINYGFDLAGRVVTVTKPVRTTGTTVVNAVTHNSYDKLGRLLQQVQPSFTVDGNALTPTVTQTVDRWGNVLQVTDVRGGFTNYYYDQNDQLTREQRPTVTVVSATGAATSERPEWLYWHDLLGRTIAIKDANGNKDVYEFDSANQVITETDANGKVTRHAYDVLGLERAKANARAFITYSDYDKLGQVTGIGQFDLTSTGSARTHALQETYALNSLGERIAVTDALNNTTLYGYDARGNLTASKTATGTVMEYAYDARGNKVRETYASRYATNTQVTDTEESPQYVYKDEQTWDYDYFGKLTDHNDLSGADFNYVYNSTTQQLVEQTSSHSDVVTIPGDREQGLPAETTSYADDRAFEFYENGLVKKISDPTSGYYSYYEYDAAGNRTVEETVTVDGRGTTVHLLTTTTFDSHGRISEVITEDFALNTPYARLDLVYEYDLVGNRRHIQAVNVYDRAPTVANAIPNKVIAKSTTTSWSWAFASNTFSDPDGGTPTYTVSGLPSWASFNASTRTFSGIPSVLGTSTITVTATDTQGANIAATFTLCVDQLPVYGGGLAAQSQTVGTQATYQFASNLFTDPDSDPITYSAALSNGSALPTGVTFNASTRTFTFNSTSVGSYTVRVTATDDKGGTGYGDFTLTVYSSGGNQAPTVYAGIDDYYGMSGYQEYQFAGNAFTDPENQTLTYTATLVGGGALPNWLTFTSSTRTFSGTRNLAYSQTIRVTASDGSLTAYCDFLFDVEYNGGQFASGGGEESMSFDLEGGGGEMAMMGGGPNTPLWAEGDLRTSQDYWFTYDAENRVTVANGNLVAGEIVIGAGLGYGLAYDDAGNAVTKLSGVTATSELIEQSTYTLDNRLESVNYESIHNITTNTYTSLGGVKERRDYDAAGRLLKVRTYYGANEMRGGSFQDGDEIYTYSQDVSGWIQSARVMTYDVDGRLVRETVMGRRDNDVVMWHDHQVGTWLEIDPTHYWHSNIVRNGLNTPEDQQDESVLDKLSETRYGTFSGNTQTGSFFDSDGRLSQFEFQNYKYEEDYTTQPGQHTNDPPAVYTHTYAYAYGGRDSFIELSVTGSSSNSSFRPATTTSYYDRHGDRLSIKEDQRTDLVDDTVRYLAVDMEGKILSRRDGTLDGSVWTETGKQKFQVYAQGNHVAEVGKDATLSVLANATAFSNGESGTKYQVQTTDTLARIAQRVYGNSAYWYVVAQANGLSGDGDLQPGVTLNLPSITTNLNDANTFKPYDPSAISGGTIPSLPYIPPPSQLNCMDYVVFAIAVVIQVYCTAVGGAFGAFFGSVMSQAFLVAAGKQDSVDFGQALQAGVSNYIMTGDLGLESGTATTAVAGGAEAASETNQTITTLDRIKRFGELALQGAASAAQSYIVNQAVGRALGNETHFSWRDLGASMLSAGLTQGFTGYADPRMTGMASGQQAPFDWSAIQRAALQAAVQVAAGYLAHQVFHHDEHYDPRMALADSFGNTLGNAMALTQQNRLQAIAKKHEGHRPIDWVHDSASNAANWFGDLFASNAPPSSGNGGGNGGNGWPTRILSDGPSGSGELAVVPGGAPALATGSLVVLDDGNGGFTTADMADFGNWQFPIGVAPPTAGDMSAIAAGVPVDASGNYVQDGNAVVLADLAEVLKGLSPDVTTVLAIPKEYEASAIKEGVFARIQTDESGAVVGYIPAGKETQFRNWAEKAKEGGLTMAVAVNGILTTHASAETSATQVSDVSGQIALFVHNPKDLGGLGDIPTLMARMYMGATSAADSVLGRSIDFARKFNMRVTHNFDATVTVIAHSEGTAIATNVLNAMKGDQRAHINYVAFAPLENQIVSGLNSFTPIANVEDPWIYAPWLGHSPVRNAVSGASIIQATDALGNSMYDGLFVNFGKYFALPNHDFAKYLATPEASRYTHYRAYVPQPKH